MEIDLVTVMEKIQNDLSNRVRLKNIICDLYPESKREMNILLIIYDSEILKTIVNNGGVDRLQYGAYVQQIVDDYGVQEHYAKAGLDLWIDAFEKCNMIQEFTSTEDDVHLSEELEEYNDEVLCGLEHDEIEKAISRDATDFEIREITDGIVEIVSYLGMNKSTLTVPNYIEGKRVIGIGEFAYEGCRGLSQVVIPEGIRYIGGGAFYKCRELRKVVLPSSLRFLYVPESISEYEEPDEGVFEECSLKEIILPQQIKKIPKRCFKYCTTLERAIFNEGLTKIDESAFLRCDGLSKINIPSTVKSIEALAFCGCFELSEAYLNEGLEFIGEKAFSGCPFLYKLMIPRSVETFGSLIVGDSDRTTLYCHRGSKAFPYARTTGYKTENAENW